MKIPSKDLYRLLRENLAPSLRERLVRMVDDFEAKLQEDCRVA